jgi:hypothetical protein
MKMLDEPDFCGFCRGIAGRIADSIRILHQVFFIEFENRFE